MKKLFFYGLAVVSMALLAACGNKTDANANGADSAATDSTVTEQQEATDPSLAETEHFTVKLPEGWALNGEPNKMKVDVKTTNTIPNYYVTIQFKDYRESIDEWKEFDMAKDVKPDGTFEAGSITYQAFSKKDSSFYTLQIVAVSPKENGTIEAMFHGAADKDINEQKDILRQIMEAVQLK